MTYTTSRVLFEDMYSVALEEQSTGQVFLTVDADLIDQHLLNDIWARFKIGYEVVSSHYDVNEKRDCFVIDRIKP